MKRLFLLTVAIAGITAESFAQQVPVDYPIQPVPFTQVHFHDQFWAPRMETNRLVTIPYVLALCRKEGRIDNFLKAAGKMPPGKLTEYPFDDTDIYKLIEGASYSLQVKPDPALEASVDTLIAIIAAAQEPDGYLYTFRTMKPEKPHEWAGTKRWEKDPELSHELYNCGHLYEAAAAHYLATGKKSMLNIATKNADLLVQVFSVGKAPWFPGHQVVEMGLAKLYRVTGKKEYLELAKYFLDIRGTGVIQGAEYNQSQQPVTSQHTAVGHAVRAAYMYTGMADVAALTGNTEYIHAINDIWKDVADHKLYLTGGIGATGNGEAFGAAYDLPNMSAYAETCASIANVYWNSRMFYLNGNAQYVDVLERILYNGLLSGISLSGDKFFYPNPLASMGQHQRSPWFNCACCISNMTRFMSSVPGYTYAQQGNKLYVNLYVASNADITLPAGKLRIGQETQYPWKGKVKMTIEPQQTAAFSLYLRVPGWAKGEAVPGSLYAFMENKRIPVTVSVNGKSLKPVMEKGYAVINRSWKKGDKVEIDLPMEIQKIVATDSVKADRGRFALQRGPLVYCLEGPDNADSAVQNIVVARNAAFTTQDAPTMFNSVVLLKGKGTASKKMENSSAIAKSEQTVTAIPYYAWNNRGPSEMEVWIPYVDSMARPKPASTIASRAKASGSLKQTKMLKGLNDQYEPESSQDHNSLFLHWWPNTKTQEWVQYDFDKEYTVSRSDVYWFDDGPFGGCRIPASWKLYYRNGDQWIPVKTTGTYTVHKDQYDTISFEPVRTNALRLEVQLPADHSAGIQEWKVE
ncbi:glycoside hydrolase family 127 protein [Flavihumibacter petaseus]|uniref:Uncharacterized protein n=1 Tax=Flavihumibacter petaseus NBRC 106054 TaxID=1220578 RepID=A0A0E9MX85_9BACT|nr:beta-L-arabinofuranosidase domain-containing protein [Flavihumibacter petaseus]GAO42113.1 hypothetical protein FPE01S_01_11260 [Flavihumibacter petaseus NBRC 106054]